MYWALLVQVDIGSRQGSLGSVADDLDVVAVRIANVAAEVARVILRPDPQLVQNFGTGGHGGIVERRARGDIFENPDCEYVQGQLGRLLPGRP